MNRILATCPPMLGVIDEFHAPARAPGLELHASEVTQMMSVPELISTVTLYDGWIIGDAPATHELFEAATAGRLRAEIKWGVGGGNVDFAACKRLGLPIVKMHSMFGRAVANWPCNVSPPVLAIASTSTRTCAREAGPSRAYSNSGCARPAWWAMTTSGATYQAPACA